jgi:hypothetical protein
MQDSLLCGETHGAMAMEHAYWGQFPKLQLKLMKTLATDRALVTSWLLALAGMPVPLQPAAVLPAVVPPPAKPHGR